MAEDHYTEEGTGLVPAGPNEVEEARKRHHLATADPDLDGTLTGPAHEEKYGLDRAEDSKQRWIAAGAHPTRNGALQPGDEGYVEPDGEQVETASAKPATETAAADRPAQA